MNHIDPVTNVELQDARIASHQSGMTPGKYTTMNLVDTVTSHNSTSMNRRSLLKLMGVGVAALSVGAVSTAERAGAEHTSQLYTVSTAANFRTGPSTSYAIISVISKGTTFTLNGQTQNGYASITYQSRSGWVLASLVVAAGSSGSQPTPVISGEAWTISAVNLRSGPSTSHQVLRVVPNAAKIGVSTNVQNDFRYVTYQGQTGWMADAYISFTNGGGDDQGGNYKTTTTALNLRAEPSTSAKILTVIPEGARVQVLHSQAGQYVNVNYNSLQGWVALAYLK
ncbi:MAG TPA: SH3 domain-containing protein [Thermomicrobiales bacterium]|nr:SH3 domain-containing protein [Thermomicrobiales bacterium]